MLGGVGQRLGHRVIGGDLDLLGKPARAPHVEPDRHRGPAGQRPQRGGEPALGEHGRVDAPGQLAQLVHGRRRLLGQGVELRVQLVRARGHGRLRRPQLHREGDQPLLGAVVQVALDPAAGVVGRGDDPGPRRGQLGLALGVRDRAGDQLGEARQPRLGVGGQPGGAAGAGGDHAPQPPLHVHRDTDRRPHAGLDHGRRQRPGVGAVPVDARGLAGLVDQRGHVAAAEGEPAPDRRGRRAGAGPRPEDGHPAVGPVPVQEREVDPEQVPDLLGDRGEHLVRRGGPRDQGGHAAQRGLLGRVVAQLEPGLRTGDGRGDQPGEAGQPRLGIGGERPLARGHQAQVPPQAAVHDDRHPDRRADPPCPRERGGLPHGLARRLAVVPDPRRPAGAHHRRAHVATAELPAGAHRQRGDHAVARPRPHHRGRPAIRVVAVHQRLLDPEQLSDLRDHAREDLLGGRRLRHERGDPAQRGLLGHVAAQLPPGELARQQPAHAREDGTGHHPPHRASPWRTPRSRSASRHDGLRSSPGPHRPSEKPIPTPPARTTDAAMGPDGRLVARGAQG